MKVNNEKRKKLLCISNENKSIKTFRTYAIIKVLFYYFTELD